MVSIARHRTSSAAIWPRASGRKRWYSPANGSGARSAGAWTLVGCTVVPGFLFSVFEIAQSDAYFSPAAAD
jgi:predicted cupin superfamily sugar epimerase